MEWVPDRVWPLRGLVVCFTLAFVEPGSLLGEVRSSSQLRKPPGSEPGSARDR